MKILMLDVETYPNKVYSWGLFNQNIGLNQIVEPGSTACWAARWHGAPEGEFFFGAEWDDNDFIGDMWDLLDEADAVIHYNGTKFDMPTLNWAFIKQGGTPPSPYKEIDLLRTVRQKFRPASKKLDFVSQELGIGAKIQHRGMDLWHGCMEGDKECHKEMRDYNIQDVFLLEELYEKLLPWIGNHPNTQVYTGERDTCPKCNSGSIQYRGFAYTNAGKSKKYRCNDCGSWSKSSKAEQFKSNLRGGNI
mgnify:CR=1 FL=1|tara:strand:+ start:8914 stop:9657 length:744 start_codon:yes stop_codon:yes gene_type:complete